MKIFCVSDLHTDWSTAGAPRFKDIEGVLDEVVAAAIAARAAAFMCLGDLCDPDTGAATIRSIALQQRTALELSSHGVENHWVVGNHDVVEDGSGTTTHSPLAVVARWVPGIHVYERPSVSTVCKGRVSLVALPFTASSHAYDPADFVSHLPAVVLPVIVAGHLHLKGIHPGSETVDMPRGRSVDWPLEELAKRVPDALLLGGHYHRRQVFEGVQVIGAAARLTFGEEGNDPGYLVVEVRDG